MAHGADITESASSLSNDFTDGLATRVADWFRRRKRR
jgi:hypothetical protein